MSVKNADNARDTFRSENAAGTRTFNIGNDASGHANVLIRNSSGITTSYLAGSGNSYFNGGNIGINDTSPDFKLDINGTLGVYDLPGNVTSTSALVRNETIGSELMTNGNFATGSNYNGSYSIAGGQLTKTSAGLAYQDVSGIVDGGMYLIKVDVASIAAATNIYLGGNNSAALVAGLQEIYMVAGSSNDFIGFNNGYSGSTGSVFNSISLKLVTSVSDQIQTRQLSSDAFGPGNGPYLPLTAGSGFPLTGELHVDDRVIIENTTNLTNGVADSLLIKNLSSGAAITNGFGTAISFYLENTVYSAVNEVAKISVIETDVIAIDEKMVFSVKDNNILADRLTLTGQEAVFTGKVGIGVTSNSAEETNNGVPRFQVNTATAVLGEFPLAARFTTGSDAGDNSGVSVLINSGNDRGLMISAGRAESNRTRATLNLVSFDGTELVDGITLYMPNTGSTGNTTGTNVGIGTTSPLTKLHIAGTTDANIIRIENTVTSLSLGSTIGAIQFFNNDPTDNSPNVAASIYATAGASGGSGSLRFKTTEPGTEGDPATDTMIVTNGGRVGIGTDSPKSLLQVAGGIQMADDTATPSATKVGTMRYRTGTEYVDVTGTNLISNPDFTTDTVWTKETGWTITGGELVATAAAGNTACYQGPGLTNGSIYRCTFTISEYTSGKVSFRAGTAAANTFFDAVGTYSVIMTAGGALQGRFSLQSGVTTTLKISQCSIVEVVAEDASYADMCMQTGSSTYEWVNIVRNTY